MPYFSSLFKFHVQVFCIYYFKIHKWHSLFIHVKRYYTFLKLKSESWSQLNFNEFETSLYIRTLYIYLLSFWYIWLHNSLTFKVSSAILFGVCRTINVMFGWRVWNWIKHEKYFLVWLLFFVDLCSRKRLVKALNFIYVQKAPFKVEE